MNWMFTRGLMPTVALIAVLAALTASAFAQDGSTQGSNTQNSTEQNATGQNSAGHNSTDDSESEKFPMWPIEEQLIEYTNRVRAQNGLPPIQMDESLVKSARQHAWWMVRNNTLQHTQAQVAENIAMGQRSANEVVRDWMNSPGHRANMLGNYSRIGAAAYQTKGGTCYWCLQFLR